jgi:membrane protein involved in colicin uptake
MSFPGACMWLCLFGLLVWGSLEAGVAAPSGGRTSDFPASLMAAVLVGYLGRAGGKAEGIGSS